MPPTHPSETLLVGLRVSAPSTDPSSESFSTSNEVSSTRVDQAVFSSESGAPATKGMASPAGVATRNSQLQCTVLTLPASSFTSYAGMQSATWWTTKYSVSLHQSLTFYRSSLAPCCPVLIVQYSWFCHSTTFVSWPCSSFGGAPQHRPH